jgi:hypothetical protein
MSKVLLQNVRPYLSFLLSSEIEASVTWKLWYNTVKASQHISVCCKELLVF